MQGALDYGSCSEHQLREGHITGSFGANSNDLYSLNLTKTQEREQQCAHWTHIVSSSRFHGTISITKVFHNGNPATSGIRPLLKMQNQFLICTALGLLEEIRLISEASKDRPAGRDPCLAKNKKGRCWHLDFS